MVFAGLCIFVCCKYANLMHLLIFQIQKAEIRKKEWRYFVHYLVSTKYWSLTALCLFSYIEFA